MDEPKGNQPERLIENESAKKNSMDDVNLSGISP